MKQTEEFCIRAYGRTELAQLYMTSYLPGSAWRLLKRWMEANPTLRQQLCAPGRLGRLRTFTPRQVRLIIAELGEP